VAQLGVTSPTIASLERVILSVIDSNVWNSASGYTYSFTRSPDGNTEVQLDMARKGKNAKGRIFALLLWSVGRVRSGSRS